MEHSIEQLRYPIGKFKPLEQVDQATLHGCIEQMSHLPQDLEKAVKSLKEGQLNTPYRPEGWTVRQVVHHIPDSHMNAYIRFKLALTEDNPIIKPYDESLWAKLPDTMVVPIQVSLVLLQAVHIRWVTLMKSMSEEDFQRTYYHPETKKTLTLEYVTTMYAWHGIHHLAHITGLIERMGW